MHPVARVRSDDVGFIRRQKATIQVKLYYDRLSVGQSVTDLVMWGDLSDEKSGL
jgi:hypothetical protein